MFRRSCTTRSSRAIASVDAIGVDGHMHACSVIKTGECSLSALHSTDVKFRAKITQFPAQIICSKPTSYMKGALIRSEM